MAPFLYSFSTSDDQNGSIEHSLIESEVDLATHELLQTRVLVSMTSPQVRAFAANPPVLEGEPLFARYVALLKEHSKGEVVSMGSRERAFLLRKDIEDRINAGQVVQLDFFGCEATQSFMDELVGILVLERGPDILSKVQFRRCSEDLKAIIQFVVSDRANQFATSSQFKAPRR